MTQAQFRGEQIVAAFDDGDAAQRAAEALRQDGVDAARVRVGSERDDHAEHGADR
jgi:hypothetical protein